jgi:hypothetical protein
MANIGLLIFIVGRTFDVEIDGGCCTQIVLMGAARPYIGQVTCQGEGVPPTEILYFSFYPDFHCFLISFLILSNYLLITIS